MPEESGDSVQVSGLKEQALKPEIRQISSFHPP